MEVPDMQWIFFAFSLDAWVDSEGFSWSRIVWFLMRKMRIWLVVPRTDFDPENQITNYLLKDNRPMESHDLIEQD